MFYSTLSFCILIASKNLIFGQISFHENSSEHEWSRSIESPLLKENDKISLCSKHHPQHLYRYHNESGKCYQIATSGPCKEGMLFFDEDDTFGGCDCDFIHSDRIVIFHPETKKCYKIFTQGYCAIGQWLIMSDIDFRPYCKSNLCFGRPTSSSTAELVPFKNKCVELESNSPDCPTNQVVTFVEDEIDPSCGPPKDPGINTLSLLVRKFRCAPGSARSITGKCQPIKKLQLS